MKPPRPAAMNEGRLQKDGQSEYSGSAELWANERDLVRYNRDVVRMLSAVPDARRVLEFGAGIGTLACLWQEANNVRPECLEIDSKLRDVITGRGLVCHASLESVDRNIDLIYSSNVLEHIEDDASALRELRQHLRPGGNLAIYVPAFMCLYSELDAAIGHFRRYRRNELEQKLKAAGYEIERANYSDSIGFFAWLWVKLRGYGPQNALGTDRSLAIYDRFIYPASRVLDRIGLNRLFGKNLLVIARNPGRPQ